MPTQKPTDSATRGALAGRVAIVTGAASGIGRAIAMRFSAEGAAVVLADIDDSVGQVAGQLEAPAVPVVGDISVPDDVERIVEGSGLGTPDVLVNCAATFKGGVFTELSLEEWDLVTRVNMTGTFLMSQSVSRAMIREPRADGASRAIVNITSLEAHRVVASTGRPSVHYAASKAAIEMLTRSLAVELAPHRVRVNAVCPDSWTRH